MTLLPFALKVSDLHSKLDDRLPQGEFSRTVAYERRNSENSTTCPSYIKENALKNNKRQKLAIAIKYRGGFCPLSN